jgi:hypothetical protein
MFARTQAQSVVLHKNSAHSLEIASYLACVAYSYTERHGEPSVCLLLQQVKRLRRIHMGGFGRGKAVIFGVYLAFPLYLA